MTSNNNASQKELAKWLLPELFKALSDPNRLTILTRLACCTEAKTVTEVAECCPVDLSVVSRHLRILRDAGIVEATKQGKSVFYSVRISDIVQLLRNLADALESCCPNGSCTLVGDNHEFKSK